MAASECLTGFADRHDLLAFGPASQFQIVADLSTWNRGL